MPQQTHYRDIYPLSYIALRVWLFNRKWDAPAVGFTTTTTVALPVVGVAAVAAVAGYGIYKGWKYAQGENS